MDAKSTLRGAGVVEQKKELQPGGSASFLDLPGRTGKVSEVNDPPQQLHPQVAVSGRQ
jgi:hypothetical protein